MKHFFEKCFWMSLTELCQALVYVNIYLLDRDVCLSTPVPTVQVQQVSRCTVTKVVNVIDVMLQTVW